MVQYLHDFPGGDPGDCKYESRRGKHCLNHHPNGGIASARPDAEKKASTEKASRETAASRKKKEMLEFVLKQWIDYIVLNGDNTNVESTSLRIRTLFVN